VDKNQFLTVVNHFSDSSVEEAQEILSLKADFPYSQMLHALSARVSRDHGFSTQQQELQLAAVYASDRSVLKDIMSKTAADLYHAPPSKPTAVVSAEAKTPEVTVTVAEESYDTVADELIHDLDRLHELKHNFEMLFADGASTPEVKISNVTEPTVVEKPTEKHEQEVKPKESGKSRKARIIEMAKALAAGNNTTPTAETNDVKAPQKERKRKEPVDSLIEEIKSTKEELKPADDKLKEQIQIIDQFIKTQPSITNVKDKLAAAPEGDLSSIKSGEFSDHIVSETLVEILLQQGKKDKAIEILKKLIWKFPQKKAYFAAQIEELKK
jgi:hypothetical protein